MHVSTSASLPQKSMTAMELERQLTLYPMTPVPITSIQFFFITYCLPILILSATYAVSMYISMCALIWLDQCMKENGSYFSSWDCVTLLDVTIHSKSINFLANFAISLFLQSWIVFHFFPTYVPDLHYLGPVGPIALCLKHNAIVGGVWDGRGRSHLSIQKAEWQGPGPWTRYALP